ncbi:MAG: sulfate adenylyltransferase subunit CysN [Deltaproteobacteria bacterium]|nr:sulfate adenylyltransferase subunit CysN [Candidatus Anaeroferrophillus wilburensis]MBN2889422.1 sulfate adenylyltransferase subunit CysN [Deltaproteobacteria bacterium]
MDIREFLDRDEQKDLLRFLTAGSVDDGKSTLIGRLLYDSKLLYEDQLSALQRDSKRVGSVGGEIDYALLLDGLKAEREQGITIDVAYRYFATDKRKFIIADTPGHEQYTRNMVTGASTANLAVILVDARTGIITQTRRHTFIVSLLGIKHVILAVNKMDLVDFDQQRFDAICQDFREFVARLKIPDLHFIPLSALKGDNVVTRSTNTPWYSGQPLLELLESIYITSDRNFIDFRFPVQYVLRPDASFRGFAGQVASGVVRPGEEVLILPSHKKSKVKEIATYDGPLDAAFSPESVTLTLEDEIDVSRGDMLVHPNNMPRTGRSFEAMLVWMDEKPMDPGTGFFIKHTTQTTRAKIDRVRYRTDVNTLRKSEVDHLSLNEIGRVTITTSRPLYFDPYMKNRTTGSFILIDPVTNYTSAVGMIIDRLASDQQPAAKPLGATGVGLVTRAEWEARLGQRGEMIRISGANHEERQAKARTLERELFDQGKIAVVVDEKTAAAAIFADSLIQYGLIVLLIEEEI